MATALSQPAQSLEAERGNRVRSLKDPKPELRVLQVFSVLGMGGAETWLMALLKYFHEQQDALPFRVRFDILLTGATKAVFDDEASALGATLFYVPFTRRTLMTFTREFRKILAEGKYDVIHDHQDYIAGLHFLLGAGHLPPRRVAHVHNPLLRISSYKKDPLRRITSAVGKQLLRRFATDIVGTSNQVLKEYGFTETAYPAAGLGAAHCGFDVSRFIGDSDRARAEICQELRIPEKSKLVLFVGRLDSDPDPKLNQKNPVFALEVGRECYARDKNIHLLMAGGGGDRVQAELVSQVNEWGLQDNIHILGMRSDVPRLMLASDLLLLPSLAEGLGMVVVEAQAAGLRTIASDKTPRECVVLKDMVGFLPLDKGQAFWAEQVIRSLAILPPDAVTCNSAVNQSAFSITSSARRLLQVYKGSA